MPASSERIPLSRARIAAAAIELGDREGLDALTMRGIGSELGVEAMSLYNHVANKEDLFDAVGDLMYTWILERYEPSADSAWRDDAWKMVSAFYGVVTEHMNISTIMLDRAIPSGVRVQYLHKCYEIFLKAGFSLTPATLTFNTVASWLTGAVRSESWMVQLSELGPVDAADLPPELQGAVGFINCCIETTAQERLRAGFDTIIAGIESQLSD